MAGVAGCVLEGAALSAACRAAESMLRGWLCTGRGGAGQDWITLRPRAAHSKSLSSNEPIYSSVIRKSIRRSATAFRLFRFAPLRVPQRRRRRGPAHAPDARPRPLSPSRSSLRHRAARFFRHDEANVDCGVLSCGRPPAPLACPGAPEVGGDAQRPAPRCPLMPRRAGPCLPRGDGSAPPSTTVIPPQPGASESHPSHV